VTVSNVLSSGERPCSVPWQVILTLVHRSDLNSSVMTGASRVVDHTTFTELQWRRDPFSPSFFILPPGFQTQSHLLSEEFVEVLKDVFALQCIRDSAFFGKEDVISMAHIDNHQASIQSRLVSLPTCSVVSECCHLAAYLCSTMLRCKIWRSSTIPVSPLNTLTVFFTAPSLIYRAVLTLNLIVPSCIAATPQATTSKQRYCMGRSA
jgi:hypothetical protein